MSADSANDFFWQAMSSSDSNGDLQLQRTAFDNFVSQGNEDSSQMQLHIQSESSPSPTSIIATSGENANNNNRLSTSSSPTSQQALYTTVNADAGSPTNTQQGLLPYGVINPDAIIPQSRSYTCRICQVTFPNKSAVTVHSRIHTDHEGKPYRCSFCGKGFSTNFYLKQHERIHNGQKPYKCPMCEHSFKQLSHVQQHVRTHTGVRPYKCHWPDCGKAFLQQSHLKSHVERHSPNLKAHVARHAPKTQKRKSSNDTKIQQEPEIPVVENQVHKENIEDNMDPGCFSLVSMPPDVIGQAAAAANIVPVPVHYESICPFLCPGCSKLYVREATFKKHLEECKTKLQLSISATAAALGIDPPPLPPPNSQSSPGFQSNTEIVVMPMDVNLNNEAAPPAPKKSRKNQKPRSVAKIELQQQQQFVDQTEQQEQILVEMPLDVNLDHCSPQLTEGSLGDNNVKQEVLGIPLDGSTTGDVMLKLPQQALSVAASANDNSNDANGVNQFFSSVAYNQIQNTSQFLDNNLFTNQQLVTSSSPLNLPIVTSQPLTSSQSIMLSGASVVGDGNIIIETFPKGGATGAGHTTINQAALKWQWDQPRMNFP
ncbi:uncharacterized protein LOC120338996 isoform X2 [Styela clava]